MRRGRLGGADPKGLLLNDRFDVLEVPRPNPTADDTEENTYVFKREAKKVHEEGPVTFGRIDLYKEGCFILEAKQAAYEEAHKGSKTKRESPAWNVLIRDAYALLVTEHRHRLPPHLPGERRQAGSFRD